MEKARQRVNEQLGFEAMKLVEVATRQFATEYMWLVTETLELDNGVYIAQAGFEVLPFWGGGPLAYTILVDAEGAATDFASDAIFCRPKLERGTSVEDRATGTVRIHESEHRYTVRESLLEAQIRRLNIAGSTRERVLKPPANEPWLKSTCG